jgi:hypothetical protein
MPESNHNPFGDILLMESNDSESEVKICGSRRVLQLRRLIHRTCRDQAAKYGRFDNIIRSNICIHVAAPSHKATESGPNGNVRDLFLINIFIRFALSNVQPHYQVHFAGLLRNTIFNDCIGLLRNESKVGKYPKAIALIRPHFHALKL